MENHVFRQKVKHVFFGGMCFCVFFLIQKVAGEVNLWKGWSSPAKPEVLPTMLNRELTDTKPRADRCNKKDDAADMLGELKHTP